MHYQIEIITLLQTILYSEGKYLNVQYGYKEVTAIKIIVKYNTKTYTYKL